MANAAVDDGQNVLVAAPTGAGKTVVAEHAVAAALSVGGRAVYTAPIKALSNQKFTDLCRELGEERVGLLTGDHSIRPDAPVLVVTTEVLRNMVYADAGALEQLRWVVLDEVHFLQDPYRGPVWEEVLIHTPAHVRFVCLSATVSNAEELGEWIGSVRGPTSTVVEHRRPVDLDPLYLVGDRSSEQDHLIPLLVGGRPNPEGRRFDAPAVPVRHQRGRPRHRFHTPRRLEVLDRLAAESLLPTICFVFSRNGCADAALSALDAGVRLTEPVERERIRAVVEQRTAALDDRDLDVLGLDRFLAALEAGVAPHHAGMVPAFREAVEQCFVEGLVKVVFATETLALGINMPARSVVVERLSKYTGDGHELLTPGQFTQLTGRAGRRGIDARGAAVVLWSPFQTFDQVAELAASRDFPLVSAFRPTYNMVANLVGRWDRPEAEHLLGRSFAQFQADRAVVALRRRADALAEELAAQDLDPALRDLGEEYERLEADVRRTRRHRRGDPAEVQRSIAGLRPGDVVERRTPQGTRLLAVVAVAHRRGGAVRARAVTVQGTEVVLDAASVAEPLLPVARVELPVPYAPSDREFRRTVGSRLRRVKVVKNRAERRRDAGLDEHDAAVLALEAHPWHGRDDLETLRATTGTARRTAASLDRVRRRIAERDGDLVTQLDRTLDVLGSTGHTEGWRLTVAGERLRRIFHESDLLVAMAVGEGLLDGLTAPETAGLVSCLTYEHRSSEPPPPPRFPRGALRERVRALQDLGARLAQAEAAARVPATRAPDPGFVDVAHAWAAGRPLAEVVDEDLTGGDFVRNVKQLVDLLTQVGEVATDPTTRRTCAEAVDALRRGVVVAGGGPA